VTQTVTGYYCTNYGVAAFVPGSVPTYAGYPGYAGYAGYAGYYPGYAGYNPAYAVAYRPLCYC
jgi:hypothetical protein